MIKRINFVLLMRFITVEQNKSKSNSNIYMLQTETFQLSKEAPSRISAVQKSVNICAHCLWVLMVLKRETQHAWSTSHIREFSLSYCLFVFRQRKWTPLKNNISEEDKTKENGSKLIIDEDNDPINVSKPDTYRSFHHRQILVILQKFTKLPGAE